MVLRMSAKNIFRKSVKMTSRTDRLLCCAVAYSNAEVSETPIPIVNSSTSVEDLIGSMMNVLWFEAKQNMSEAMTDVPSDPYLHAVDIDTAEPGIVASKTKMDIYRRKLPTPSITYRQREPMKLYNVFENLIPDLSTEEAIAKADKDDQKRMKSNQKSASRELRHERESLDKIEKRQEQKEKRKNETPEERESRLQESREKKAKRKAEKELKEEVKKNQQEPDEEDSPIEVEKKLANKESDTIENMSINVQEMLEAEASADKILHSLLPSRVKARNRKTKFHPSPVPFDRHLVALEASWPAQHVKEAFIDIIPDKRVQIIQGPPGTGKTTELLNRLQYYSDKRIFLCAGTNVGAANLYTRCLGLGYQCSLLMPQSRIPPGTPIVSQDPNHRIICSTISGRSGPVLDSQAFDVIMVDEAAQCMEAWFWGLIRPEVEHVVMVGDPAQLPALVSEKGQKLGHDRSLMQRLIESEYPYTMLKTQHRMHPEIVAFPNEFVYSGQLKTQYEAPAFEHDPYSMYNIKGTCVEIGTSFVNEMEAEFCVKKALMLKELSNDVVILCPYQAQARQILSLGSDIHVHTVDSFQGREADIVVLSVVRTDSCGFWNDKRRLCVALTRAKHVLCVVGNCEEWSDNLSSMYKDAQERNVIKHM